MRKSGRFRCGFAIAVISLTLLGSDAMAGSFDLCVNDVSGLDDAWPLMGGLPFPEGELRDASRIRIVGDDGQEVPAQVDVAATWRDGSIRWALAGFTASPRGKYQVQYGPDVTQCAPAQPLRIERDETGGLTIDTGAAIYEFLPENARMKETAFLAGSGDGAYLVDNQGRTARVAGAKADVACEMVRHGPARAVLRREGWYVTGGGERVARARAWFYFAAGCPYLRVTHSLILTEDTNNIWARDYGLQFRTPAPPREATFALGKAEQAADDLLSMRPIEVASFCTATPDDGEVFMVQDVFPHFLEREARAIVGRATPFDRERFGSGAVRHVSSDWQRLRAAPAVADWADGAWDNHGVTVVLPWMAQRFPKEIAFGSEGARVAFWSGRSGQELDFRTATLIKDYWQRWAERAPEGVEALAAAPSNAQGAARTHDVWLLPHATAEDRRTIAARARAASQPPLLLADPQWLTATEAVGWPMHPVDNRRFPEEEAVLSEFWDRLMSRYEELRRTGFIAWGDPPLIRGAGSQFFRVSGQVDYGLRRHVWGLFARSGDRRYYDYGARFNRFAGDWSIVHHATDEKFIGGFTTARPLSGFWSRPLYWGTHGALEPAGGNTGHDIVNWLLEYYLTGDEYAIELTRMHGEAFKAHWGQTSQSKERFDGIFMILRVLANLYAREWDDDFGRMARELARYVIDLDSPNGINDGIRFGSLYKVDRNLISLYYYYRETGDPLAREAFLKGIAYEYRFNRVNWAFAGQAYPSFLFSVAYRWTGDPNYLRVVNASVDEHRRWPGTVNITSQINPTMGLPAALGVLAEATGPITAFPVVRQYGNPPSRILFRKPADRPVTLRIHLRMSDDLEEDAAATAVVVPHPADGGDKPMKGLRVETEAMFRTAYAGRSDPRRRHVSLTLPAEKPPGLYALEFPGAEFVDVLDTDAPQVSVHAPEGFRMQGSRAIDYFRTSAEVDTLRLFLGVPTEVRRPDGSVALEADAGNIGEQQIPAGGRAGFWRVNATESGIVRLLNAEPLFSREPQWLVTGAEVAPAPRFEPPSADPAFVPGRRGLQALHMPGNARLHFPRGAKTAQGNEHFPGGKGTVEFWFRPNWSSTDLAYAMGNRFNDHYFLRAGSHDLQYRRGRARANAPEFASLNLWAHGQESNAGFTGRFWFKAGQWYHIAAIWRTEDGKPGNDGHYAVYVNGEPVGPDDFGSGGILHYWPGRVSGGDLFRRREADEAIAIGPLDGTIAQIRISDTVRYRSAFEPPQTLPEPDTHTLAQFPLDANRLGECAGGTKIELELKR